VHLCINAGVLFNPKTFNSFIKVEYISKSFVNSIILGLCEDIKSSLAYKISRDRDVLSFP